MNIKALMKSAKIFVVDHSPEILTAIGTVGLIVSGIMAVNETPRAMDILEAHLADKEENDEPYSLSTKEKIQDCWKVYLPSILMATGSVACIIFARRIDSSRAAALATAYKMSEEALMRLEDATKDEFGERKLKRLEEKGEIKEMESQPLDDIHDTGMGNELFYECYTGTFFRSSINAIDKALNSYTKEILDDDYSDINGWITRLGLRAMDDDIGDQLGINSSMIRQDSLQTSITYGGGPLGEPCGYLKLSVRPIPNYWNPHG